jgi:hypothetical protein
LSCGQPGSCVSGQSPIAPKTWHYVVLVRTGRRIAVHLDGRKEPELVATAEGCTDAGLASFFIGGRDSREASLEGKIDEVAFYDRPLTPAEITEHFRAAGNQHDTRDRQ